MKKTGVVLIALFLVAGAAGPKEKLLPEHKEWLETVSPIITKIHFDVAMTMIADTLYTMLAQKLRGFEDCDAPKIYRHFVRGKGVVSVKDKTVSVTYPRRAHNPILRQLPWGRLPQGVPGLDDASLVLKFK